MLRIKKDDQVIVISGKDKGKVGRVIHVYPKGERALVEHVNYVKKARRRSQKDPQGGFVEVERPIHLSNIMLVDKRGNKPTRFGTNVLQDGSKVRMAKKSQEVI